MCQHKNTKTRKLPFTGAVSRDQNRAAHGGVCERETCLDCEMVREININGCHVEEGKWHLPFEVRARRKGLEMLREIKPIRLTSPDGQRQATVRLEADGIYFVHCPSGMSEHDEENILRSIPEDWAARARKCSLLLKADYRAEL